MISNQATDAGFDMLGNGIAIGLRGVNAAGGQSAQIGKLIAEIALKAGFMLMMMRLRSVRTIPSGVHSKMLCNKAFCCRASLSDVCRSARSLACAPRCLAIGNLNDAADHAEGLAVRSTLHNVAAVLYPNIAAILAPHPVFGKVRLSRLQRTA